MALFNVSVFMCTWHILHILRRIYNYTYICCMHMFICYAAMGAHIYSHYCYYCFQHRIVYIVYISTFISILVGACLTGFALLAKTINLYGLVEIANIIIIKTTICSLLRDSFDRHVDTQCFGSICSSWLSSYKCIICKYNINNNIHMWAHFWCRTG